VEGGKVVDGRLNRLGIEQRGIYSGTGRKLREGREAIKAK